MDRGTNACNFLLGKVVPLRLGYVGVVNRCQEVCIFVNCHLSFICGIVINRTFCYGFPFREVQIIM